MRVRRLGMKALSPDDYQRFRKILQDNSVNRTIDQDVALGQRREITTTPTFFITFRGREQRIVGGIPYTVLKDFFDRMLK